MRFIIFFSVILILFGSTGYYVWNRIAQLFAGTFLASKTFLAIFFFFLFSFIIGKIWESYYINIFSEGLVKIGAYTIGLFFYVFIAVLFIDLMRLINFLLPFIPSEITQNPQANKFVGAVLLSFVVVLVGYGIWNASNPRIKTIDLEVNKQVEGLKSMKIVALSDTHFGTLVAHNKGKRLTEKINELNPDLVLIAGDIIDDNIKVVKKHDLLKHFKEIKSTYGTFGIMGNHEYIGRSYTDIQYYEQNNIRMLIDSSVLVADKFYIIGRDDLQAKAFFNRSRKSTEELTSALDKSKAIFLMDHQPYNLEESEKAGIDFHLSGHTHHGQFWPFSLITGRIFEEDWGYLKKGKSHFYISSGYGTFGPPIRIGSHSEIVEINMTFN